MRNLLSITIFLISFLSFSQTAKKTTFGFKGGANVSMIRGVELDGSKTGYGGIDLYGSLFADTALSKKWNLEYELLFSYTDDYHFVETPIHLKYNLSNKWNLLFGPKIDFLVDDDNEYFEGNYKFKNFGVSFELGTQYNFGKKLFAELRYSNGITEQIDDLSLEIYNGKRNTLRLGLGVKF